MTIRFVVIVSFVIAVFIFLHALSLALFLLSPWPGLLLFLVLCVFSHNQSGIFYAHNNNNLSHLLFIRSFVHQTKLEQAVKFNCILWGQWHNEYCLCSVCISLCPLLVSIIDATIKCSSIDW